MCVATVSVEYGLNACKTAPPTDASCNTKRAGRPRPLWVSVSQCELSWIGSSWIELGSPPCRLSMTLCHTFPRVHQKMMMMMTIKRMMHSMMGPPRLPTNQNRGLSFRYGDSGVESILSTRGGTRRTMPMQAASILFEGITVRCWMKTLAIPWYHPQCPDNRGVVWTMAFTLTMMMMKKKKVPTNTVASGPSFRM